MTTNEHQYPTIHDILEPMWDGETQTFGDYEFERCVRHRCLVDLGCRTSCARYHTFDQDVWERADGPVKQFRRWWKTRGLKCEVADFWGRDFVWRYRGAVDVCAHDTDGNFVLIVLTTAKVKPAPRPYIVLYAAAQARLCAAKYVIIVSLGQHSYKEATIELAELAEAQKKVRYLAEQWWESAVKTDYTMPQEN
jgi:hypothetical protein